jgi:hypothetical protein
LRDWPGLAVEVTIVDPRNLFGFLALAFSEGARFGVPWRERWRTALTGASVASVIADGRVVSVGRIPPAAEVVAAMPAPGGTIAAEAGA